MLEPQGTLFLILLLLAFGGLITWVALAGRVVFRVIAACLAFIPAMVFGIFAVNKYYDYYQTWGALYNDLSGQTTSIPHLTAAGLGKGTAGSLKSLIAGLERLPDRRAVRAALQRHHHRPPHATSAGRRYVYLPPQYFQKAYANYRFPAIELLHGSPGEPSGLGERDERGPDLPERDGQRQGQARRPGDAEHRRRPAVRAAVPQRPGRRPGHDLRGRGGPGLGRRQPPGAAGPARPGASRATRRAATAPPTSPCSTRTCSATPGPSAATSRRSRARCRSAARPAARRSTSTTSPAARSCCCSTRPTST